MLPRPPAGVAIETVVGTYNIGNGQIHAKTLLGPKFHTLVNKPPRQALLIHGEELGANHTLLERPGRWLVSQDLFDEVILPDRRGCGGSSVATHPLTLREQADDMRRLLDRINLPGPLAAIGVSYGGPVALTLAAIDPRVECVALVASGLALIPPNWLVRLFQRTGLLQRLVDRQIRSRLGKFPAQEFNFDPGYDASNPRDMSTLFTQALKFVPPERANSLLLEYQATNDPDLVAVPGDLALDIPVLQVIGEWDEVWGSQIPPEDLRRFPNFHRQVVPGAIMHKDVYFRAEAFYQALIELLRRACPLVK